MTRSTTLFIGGVAAARPLLVGALLALAPALAACPGCNPPPVADAGGDGDGDLDGGPVTPVDGGGGQYVTDPIREPDPNDPNNPFYDSDCDGISDADEYAQAYAGGTKTDPADWDSDDDGLADGVEAGADQVIDAECPATWADSDTSTTTNPTVGDTDGDCIADGEEDANLNGAVDPPESDPNALDSDGDGLLDGQEDVSCDGVQDPGETSAGLADTDGDGIRDKVEIDVTNTDPLNPDTDGDGIPDGAEDLNQNGVLDPGETDPNVPDLDSDQDGIADSKEVAFGYDPNDPDMDDDGLCDGPGGGGGACAPGEDVNADGVTQPTESWPDDPDSDCDGLSDGEEQSLGTSARVRDSDGDLVSDGVEAGASAQVPGGCMAALLDADPASVTDPLAADSDGDGLNDGLEDRNLDGALAAPDPGNYQETDPTRPDTDDDGACDGPGTVAGDCVAGEDLNRNGFTDPGERDPRVPDVDTDADGLSDAVEATLGTDPNDPDSDDDTLLDGAEVSVHGTTPLSPDTDCDGLSDAAEATGPTDPLVSDSDGDGLPDGIELGAAQLLDPVRCVGITLPDIDPATTTDPMDPDSDDDGVPDGAEDANGNGRVDLGELDPLNGNDIVGPVASACLTPIAPAFHSHAEADVRLATAPTLPATSTHTISVTATGEQIGVLTWDNVNKVGAFAVRKAPEGQDVGDELGAYIEPRLIFVEAPIVRSLPTTWDGYAGVTATYDNLGAVGLGQRLSQFAKLALGYTALDPAVTVPLAGVPADLGPFRLGIEVVRRSDNVTIVVGAITPLALHTNPSSGNDYRLDDLVNGTALGQFLDENGLQCDPFASDAEQPVDIMWVVDNSLSMEDAQASVITAKDAMVAQLDNSTLDWRIAVVTTDFQLRATGPTFDGNGQGSCTFDVVAGQNNYAGPRVCMCSFTRDAQVFADCIAALGLTGAQSEGAYGPMRSALDDVLLPAAYGGGGQELPEKLRPDARVVMIALSDAGEQSITSLQNPTLVGDSNSWIAYFTGGDHAVHATWDETRADEPPLLVHGILCPRQASCSTEEDSTGAGSLYQFRYYQVLEALGATIGSISQPTGQAPADAEDIEASITAILDSVIAAVSPYQLSNPPISATIKVAMAGPVLNAGACGSLDDVRRSKQDGFSYDGASQRIAFFGGCRPQGDGSALAASYRTWIDRSDNPDGEVPCGGPCPDPFLCVNDQCLCPADCGTGQPLPDGYTCDAVLCQPACLADCGGCPLGQVCETTACGCGCPDDCNGAQPDPSFVCDPATCQWTCPDDGCDLAERPAGDNWVCGPTCEWTCPADCGEDLGPGFACNTATCEPVCSPDCNGTCAGYETCDTGTCDCVCLQDVTCAPGFAYDDAACACTCDADALACPVTHDADLESCTCACRTDAEGNRDCCDGRPGFVCTPLCTCESNIGG